MIEPEPYVKKTAKKRIAVMDTETDPFDGSTIVKPFSCGFFDGQIYIDFWGDDCIAQYFDYISTRDDELIIYAHNGGNFDFYFLMYNWDDKTKPFIIDGRIVQTFFGGQEHRDSYKILPVPLKGYKKTDIDYNKMKAGVRHKHKREILEYQKDDCLYLYELVKAYHDEFGDRLTIGSTALPMLKSFHGYETLTPAIDAKFRPYYFGGRVQCFETGVINGRFHIYDVNSMYPAVMKNALHPIGSKFRMGARIRRDTQFACIDAINNGALPSRSKDGSLDFTRKTGTFYATIHEINAGLETGTLKINKVKHAWDCDDTVSFDEFVDHFYSQRMVARDNGDLARDLFYKLILNSSYGKFAQDPSDYKEYIITHGDIPDAGKGEEWSVATITDEYYIWERPTRRTFSAYKNVATAASITGAARSILLRGINHAKRPIYCDTDSIICEGLSESNSVTINPKILGAWKHEGNAERLAICGKKLYGVYSKTKPEKGEIDFVQGMYLIKKATKGGKLNGSEILRVAKGEHVEYSNPVPNFKATLDGRNPFTTRTFKRTG